MAHCSTRYARGSRESGEQRERPTIPTGVLGKCHIALVQAENPGRQKTLTK